MAPGKKRMDTRNFKKTILKSTNGTFWSKTTSIWDQRTQKGGREPRKSSQAGARESDQIQDLEFDLGSGEGGGDRRKP